MKPLLASRIERERYPIHVVNASITGDTTAGGRARLPALLARGGPVSLLLLGRNPEQLRHTLGDEASAAIPP